MLAVHLMQFALLLQCNGLLLHLLEDGGEGTHIYVPQKTRILSPHDTHYGCLHASDHSPGMGLLRDVMAEVTVAVMGAYNPCFLPYFLLL